MSSTYSAHFLFNSVAGRVRSRPSSQTRRSFTLRRTSSAMMLYTMKLLMAVVFCLCFAVPSPVLSFTMPGVAFPANQMADNEEMAGDENEIHSIAQNLIHSVLADAEEENGPRQAVDDDEEILSKRAAGSSKRPEREIRARAHPAFPLGRRNPMSSRSKFTFGKRSQPQLVRPSTQEILDELRLDAAAVDSWRNSKQLELLKDAALYDSMQDNHQVQKDAYSSFSFGKRGMSAFSFGKRGMPSFAFGKRAVPSFAFGKRGVGSAFAFGKRDWDPTEQDLAAFEETGPYDVKRADLAFAFGKRDTQ
ncbi:uncharacterized protein [Diadema antillarum]|uniref:uncharacterized protein n=2 Tax=Diadema antillarum TaxID=105358 RepID=UPI003A878138